MNLIAAVSKNWGIGKGNDLLFHIPKDMKFFRETTLGKVIVLGRKTLESFPGKKPLKNRTNIVLTRDAHYAAEDVLLCHSPAELLELLKQYDTADVFICGGEQIYNLLLPYCDTAYITKVDAAADAEKFMVNLDGQPDWELAEESEPLEDNGYQFTFCTYKKRTDYDMHPKS